MTRRMNGGMIAAVAGLVAVDWLTKLWVTRSLALGESYALVEGWIQFVHRQNPGVAFSMFADLPEAWRTPILAAVGVVGVVLFSRIIITSTDHIVRAAAAVVLAGAIGNLGDRLINGYVTDFILVRYFPFVFNVADAAISIGGILLAARLLLAEEAVESPAASALPDARNP